MHNKIFIILKNCSFKLFNKIAMLKNFILKKQKNDSNSSQGELVRHSNINTTNKYFITIIFISLISSVIISYFEQYNKLKQQNFKKIELVKTRIDQTILGYKQSLDNLSKSILRNSHYLDPLKTLQLLKFFYIFDSDIKLSPVTWHYLNDSQQAISVFGNEPAGVDLGTLEKIKQNSNKPLVLDQPSRTNPLKLVIIYPSLDDQGKELIGYLKAQVKFSLLLKTLYDVIDKDELIKITKQDNSNIYLLKSEKNNHLNINKEDNLFEVASSEIADKNMQFLNFSQDLQFSQLPYVISVFKNKQILISEVFKISMQRGFIILILGSFILIAYNYLERKRFKKIIQDNLPLVNKIDFLEQKIITLELESEDYEIKYELLSKKLETLLSSLNEVSKIDNQAKNGYYNYLHKIQEHLLLNHYVKEEITFEFVKKIFADIYKISEDLQHNIFTREDPPAKIDLTQIINEVLVIFAPIANSRSVKISLELEEITIQANALILKQILISLFARIFYLIAHENYVNISAKHNEEKNQVKIEIIDNSFGFNETLFKNINNEGASVLANMSNILLEIKSLKKLVREILHGDIEIRNSHNNGNKITLILPIMTSDTNSNIIYMSKIAAR